MGAAEDPRADPQALLALDDALLAAWRNGMVAAGFDATIVARAEAIAPGMLDPIRLPLVHAWLGGVDEPVAIWARLFAYRDAVPAQDVTETLGEALATALRDAGVLVVGPGGERSRVRVMPFAGTHIASDETDARHDPVMGPGATTIELWRALAVPAGATLLDVGCGAGSLALAALRHGAGQVVGVDIDPRAIAYARFNARLNALPQARFAVGDLLQPVAGERFDWVVSQPPFVMRPPSVQAATYLHGGARGDELTMTLLSRVGDVLADNGRALVLFDTAVVGERGVLPRIRQALGDTALHVLAISAAGHSPDLQAIGYASTTYGDLGPEYGEAVASYRAHLRTLGIAASRHVLLQLRRPRPGQTPAAAEIESRGAQPYDAAELAQADAALTLAASAVPTLMAARVGVASHAWLCAEQQPAKPEAGRYRVRFEGAARGTKILSPAAAGLLELLAEGGSVGDAVERYAALCESTTAQVADSVLAFVRESLVSGLLTVDGSADR